MAKGSEEFLPSASLPALDLVLVDGDHAFPLPWYYTADQLVVGGLMIVDDIQLISGRLLADFLDADPRWERVRYRERRFAVFRKRSHPIRGVHWLAQPYVATSNPVRQVSVVRYTEPRVALHAVYARLPASVQRFYRAIRRLVQRRPH